MLPGHDHRACPISAANRPARTPDGPGRPGAAIEASVSPAFTTYSCPCGRRGLSQGAATQRADRQRQEDKQPHGQHQYHPGQRRPLRRLEAGEPGRGTARRYSLGRASTLYSRLTPRSWSVPRRSRPVGLSSPNTCSLLSHCSTNTCSLSTLPTNSLFVPGRRYRACDNGRPGGTAAPEPRPGVWPRAERTDVCSGTPDLAIVVGPRTDVRPRRGPARRATAGSDQRRHPWPRS